MSVGADGERMYRPKKQEILPTCVYSKEKLQEVKCIPCGKQFNIKITEHQTIVNEHVNKYKTLTDIFCPNCAAPYIGINLSTY